MKFCKKCRSVLTDVETGWTCESCGWELEKATGPQTESSAGGGVSGTEPGTELETLPTTNSGSIRKAKAMEWLHARDRPTEDELIRATTPKPNGFTGSTYASEVSNIRVTGDPSFIETIAGLLKPLLELEGTATRLEVNLQQTEDRESGEFTDNYALYLSAAERS